MDTILVHDDNVIWLRMWSPIHRRVFSTERHWQRHPSQYNCIEVIVPHLTPAALARLEHHHA
jgi:hypothetical protein